jgi:hypothetical protein
MGAIATVIGGAVSGNPLTAVIDLGKDLIDKFVPDPAQKAAAQAQVLQVQAQLQEALIDQQNKVIEATSANQKDDHYMKFVRAFFSISVTCLYLWNYAFCRLAHQEPIDIPVSLTTMFGCLMLGFVGVPAGIEAVKEIMVMPGESHVQLPGLKIGNKN